MSMPTVPIANPMSADSAPSNLLPRRITMTVSRPATTTRKYSGGPKVRAKSAVIGAAKDSSTAPMVPATNEATAAITSAGPARPCFASG
jgi:hypothetical protein